MCPAAAFREPEAAAGFGSGLPGSVAGRFLPGTVAAGSGGELPALRAALETAAARDPSRQQELDWLTRLEQGPYCRSLRQLAVSGRELTALGIPAGPQLGRLLAGLLRAVIAGEAENTPEALLALAEQKWRE